MTQSIIISQPSQSTSLLLLFHGVGASAMGMQGVGQFLGRSYPQAAVVAVNSPDSCDLGQGYQWFSVQGVTEDNRLDRIAVTLPRFNETVLYWQQKFGLSAQKTALIGFSQGAIMSLEAMKQPVPLASHVVSLSGRFATLPTQLSTDTHFAFFHGEQDPVIAITHAEAANERLRALNVRSQRYRYPNLRHEVGKEELQDLVRNLKTL